VDKSSQSLFFRTISWRKAGRKKAWARERSARFSVSTSNVFTRSLSKSINCPESPKFPGTKIGSEEFSTTWIKSSANSFGLTKSPSTIEGCLQSRGWLLSLMSLSKTSKDLDSVPRYALSLKMAYFSPSSEWAQIQPKPSFTSLNNSKMLWETIETPSRMLGSSTNTRDSTQSTFWTTLRFTAMNIQGSTFTTERLCAWLFLNTLPSSTL